MTPTALNSGDCIYVGYYKPLACLGLSRPRLGSCTYWRIQDCATEATSPGNHSGRELEQQVLSHTGKEPRRRLE
jgi:hypothetical protein